MKYKPKIIDWLLCDDVRMELHGKTTFVGVYGDDIIVSSIPFKIPQLCIVTKWDLKNKTFEDISLRIERPDNKDIRPPIKVKPPKIKDKKRYSLILSLFPFEIPLAGIYKLFVKVDDDIEKKIGEFEVKLSETK